MDRRLIGALLVVAVLAVAVVLPARDGIGVAGTATPMALPADPRVGDCLLSTYQGFEPTTGLASKNISTGDPSSPTTDRAQTPLIFGNCNSGDVAGEVLAVLYVSGDAASRAARISAIGPDCQELAFAYAGLLPATGNHYRLPNPPAGPVTWNPAVNLRDAWIFPDPLARSAGRIWAACVAGPASGGLYDGRLLSAFDGGELPDGFGSCWDQRSMSVAMRSVNCGDPHQAEIISTGTVPAHSPVTRAEVEDSCHRLAGRVMGRADPTSGGVLDIRVDPSYDALPTDRKLDIICYVVPIEGSLSGTLIGLGERPVPLTR